MTKSIISLLRIKHWIKNLLIFVPLVFSFNILNRDAVIPVFTIFLAFCAGSSFVYVINDFCDRERDAKHPVKRFRPIPSGKISMPLAWALAGGCLAVGIALGIGASLYDSFYTLATLIAYIAINILYSRWLKHVAILDVLCISLGFALRVLAGGVAIGVALSNWLVLTIMALSLFLGFGKRRNEIRQTLSGSGSREVLEQYGAAFLDKSMYAMMTLSIAFYALWTIDPATTASFGGASVWTTLVVIVILLRYSLCIERDSDGDPTSVIFSDRPLMLLSAFYCLIILLMVILNHANMIL